MRLLTLSLVVLVFKSTNCTIGRRANKKFIKPCFDGDENENTCSEPSDSCRDKLGTEFKLVHLDGFKTGHVQWMEVGDGNKKVKLITRAMKPLIFEIPEFLSEEECDHIISLAKENGLQTSTSGFFSYAEDLDAALAIADSNWTLPREISFAAKFDAWDENRDGFVDPQEVKLFAEKYRQLYLQDDELHEMFERLQINNELTNGRLTKQSFKELNSKKILGYMDFLKNNSPRHRFRFSQQTWLPQDKTADRVLRRLYERIIKLTKLPRKIVQGGEPMQVVRYEKFGHFHAHMDSTIKDPNVPCCHQNHLGASDCRVCRFITILYFLNDVEEGGQTAFLMADNTTITPEEIERTDEINLSMNCRSANLILPPKKGTAVMWYNNFIDPESGLLGSVDRRTLHGGCDVIRGEKWIANNWLTAPTKHSRYINSMFDTGFD